MRPLVPLRPQVVRLDSGVVIKRNLVGIDPQAYESLRVNTALDQQQLAARAAQLAQLRDILRQDSLVTQRSTGELSATRRDNAALSAALRRQETLASKALALPLRPPLLLDAHTYIGCGASIALLGLLKLLILH